MSSRFEFGANWRRFLESVDEARINAAERSLVNMLERESLEGLTFLDVGCGSGLFSLAACRLGARVHSFDYDPRSVACTREMQRRFAPDSHSTWTIQQGSALDPDYLNSVPKADIVCSWGVLHHTGDMWRAIDLVSQQVAPGGTFWIAIYNDQGPMSEHWAAIKRLYVRLPRCLRPALVVFVGGTLATGKLIRTLGSMLLSLITVRNPLAPAQALSKRLQAPEPRGMHRWYDLVDWVGGWPFEVASPGEIVDFMHARSFRLVKLRTVGGKLGCNEFVFQNAPTE